MNPILRRAAKALLPLLPLTASRAIRFRAHATHWPRLRTPLGLNEKINWRILYDRRSIFDWTCDKLESKRRAAELSPGILLPEVLWSGEDLSELAGIAVEGRWIMKSNSSSQDVIVGEGTPDIDLIAVRIARWKTDFQWKVNGERAYAHARRAVILERWISESSEPPNDYKVLVYEGVARYVHVHTTRFTGHEASLYTREWAFLDGVRQHHIPPNTAPVPRPPHLEEILYRAEQIAAGFDFMRVDLYDTEEGVWFGETTPYAWSGFRPFIPDAVERELGSHWHLPTRREVRGNRGPRRRR